MPLPPALLARLQKRGIVKQEEEVIAENYEKEPEKKSFEENSAGAPGCPNKWNQYHVCLEFCYDHWGDGTPEYRFVLNFSEKLIKNRFFLQVAREICAEQKQNACKVSTSRKLG